jgi:hypothetical protein
MNEEFGLVFLSKADRLEVRSLACVASSFVTLRATAFQSSGPGTHQRDRELSGRRINFTFLPRDEALRFTVLW